MKLLKVLKDKQGRPLAKVDIVQGEIDTILESISEYPADDATMQGRLNAIKNKSDWTLHSQQDIRDEKEVVNWNLQNKNSSLLFIDLYRELHAIWKEMNPS